MEVSGGSTVLVFLTISESLLQHALTFSWYSNTFQFFPDHGDSVFVSFTPVKATLQSPWTWIAVKRIAYLGGCVFAVFMKLVHLMIHLFQLQLNILTLFLQISLLCHLLADRLFIQYKTTVIGGFWGGIWGSLFKYRVTTFTWTSSGMG